MELFENESERNLLPKDGVVNYFDKIFNQTEADHFIKKLLTSIEWRNDEAIIFGKKIITKRKAAWYGDKQFKYTYSKITKQALIWTTELLELKTTVEERTGESFNSCLLNLYHSGNEGMGWHSDNEKNLKSNGSIASLSFGAARKFSFKHKKSKEKVGIDLEHGSLLVMKGETQRHWLHMLPTSKKILKPRVNLTFRTIID